MIDREFTRGFVKLYTLWRTSQTEVHGLQIMEEMRELAHQLEESEAPNTCPHGRPTMIHMSAGMLAREFGRR